MNLEIANRLQKLRKEKGYSQEELANELGISRQAVSKWERAEASPDTDNLICLAKIYNVSLDYLLSNDDSIETIKTEQMSEKVETIKKDTPKWVGAVNTLIPLVITIAYFLMGTIGNLWHPGWIIFLFIPILYSVVEVIVKKRFSEFLYPVFATAVYLFIGCVYNLWHPGWVVFITVPIFYSIVSIFEKPKDNEEDLENE